MIFCDNTDALLSRTNKTLSELTSVIPKYYSTPELRLECSNDKEKFKISKKANEYFDKANYNFEGTSDLFSK